jgi:hypothetical protein
VFGESPPEDEERMIKVFAEFLRNHAKSSLTVTNPTASEDKFRIDLIEFLRWAKNKEIDIDERMLKTIEQAQNRVVGAAVRELRTSQRHKEMCRGIASYLWSKSPDMTITAMAMSADIFKHGCEEKGYRQETIEGWIRDKCPNPSVGRPRKR